MDRDSITAWLEPLQKGDSRAAQLLWGKLAPRLCRFAREKIGPGKRRVADEEDVVLSAFNSFLRRAESGQFPHLVDSASLWNILLTITSRKAFDLQKHEHRLKRGGGNVRGDSAFAGSPDNETPGGMEQVVGHEPTPEFAALMTEQYERLLAQLETPELRDVALMRLENYSVAEIAEAMNCSVRTVKRRLAMIRELWEGGSRDDGTIELPRP
jgi:DNA-directed RNA polymerase specialized sigma24 family protein